MGVVFHHYEVNECDLIWAMLSPPWQTVSLTPARQSKPSVPAEAKIATIVFSGQPPQNLSTAMFCYGQTKKWGVTTRSLSGKVWRPVEETGVAVHVCYLSTWKVEEGRSGIQGHPQLHTKFKVNVGYRSPFLKREKKKRQPLDYHYFLLYWSRQ